MYLVHLLNKYIIDQNSFMLITKFKAFAIILKYSDELPIQEYFEPFVKNINICGHAKNANKLLSLIFNHSDQHYHLLFENILNLIPEA